MIELNINDQAIVRLTNAGRESLFDYWDGLSAINEPTKYYSVSEDGTLKMPLWELMQVFGGYLFMGMTEVIFEDNQIKIEKVT